MSDLTDNESLAQMQEIALPQPDLVEERNVGEADIVRDVTEAAED